MKKAHTIQKRISPGFQLFFFLMPAYPPNKLLPSHFIPGLLLVLLSFTATAQGFVSLDDEIAALPLEAATYLENLVYDPQPTVYVEHGSITTYGNQIPRVANCDVDSASLLFDPHPYFHRIEMIRINIGNNTPLPYITTESLEHFPDLQYLYVVYSYDVCQDGTAHCLPDILDQRVSLDEDQPGLLFNVAIPN